MADEWVSVIPSKCPKAPVNSLGEPSAKYPYKNADGSKSWAVYRWNWPQGKEFRPLSLWRDEGGVLGWAWKCPPNPCGLFGLDQLNKRPEAPVLIVEGEKTADAAAKLFPGWVCTTSGSATSAKSADWSPLKSRRCVIWPDHDKPGRSYAEAVSEAARKAGAASIAVVPVPSNWPDGWDLADAPPDSWDANRLRELLETAKQVDQSPAKEGVPSLRTAEAPMEWPEPQPLTSMTESAPYPIDALPETIRAAVVEVHKFVQAPVPLVASSALAALSLAIQTQWDMERAGKHLSGPVGLFLLTIADSGERKSTCDGFFTAPIREYEAQQAEDAKPSLKEFKAAFATWEARENGLKDAIRSAAKAQKDTQVLGAMLTNLENSKPEAPRVPRLLYADATPEELKWKLAKTWPSGGVVSNEGGVVFGAHAMGGDNVMRNLGTLNQLWDGADIATDRRTSESFTVRGARLTIAIQVQEATLRSFLDQTKGLARGSGFVARFLVAWPESTQGSRPFTEPPASWPRLAAFNRRISNLLNQPVPIDENGALNPQALGFSSAAKSAWVEFHDRIEAELSSGGKFHDVQDVASKIADNAARIAALFHAFEGAAGSAVGITSFESASRIAEWHLNEARRFFGQFALPVGLANAARLESWLIDRCQKNQVDKVPTKEAQQYGPNGLRERAVIDAAMLELEELGRAQRIHEGKRKFLAVNPSLLCTWPPATAIPAIPATRQRELDAKNSKSSNNSGSSPSLPSDQAAPLVLVTHETARPLGGVAV